jgi:primosomal protein N'
MAAIISVASPLSPRTSQINCPISWAKKHMDVEDWITLVGDATKIPEKATKSRAVADALAAGPRPLSALDAPAVLRMEKTGMVRRETREKRDPFVPDVAPTPPPVLNAEQTAVVEAVQGKGTWLLHGVTGAGKTEVYLALATRAIEAGKQVLVLVPEIALTPQLMARFAARFPGRVAALHSALTGAERLRAWRRIDAGEADVAIGARSAIFAPIPRLGLVVVDEENDDSYKQEDGVRYLHFGSHWVQGAMRIARPWALDELRPLWLHARAYAGPGWAFECPPPAWAGAGWRAPALGGASGGAV